MLNRLIRRWTKASEAPRASQRRGRLRLEPLEARDVPAATLLTPGQPAGTAANGDSVNIIGVSDDATKILFTSAASNLVAGVSDTNNATDLFWRDLKTGTTKLVSAKTGNVAAGFDDTAGNAVLSGNGQFVAFVSKTQAQLLTGVATQTDQADTPDVFRWDSTAGTTALVSIDVAGKAVGNTAGVQATNPNISADGKFVSYLSNLVATAIDASTFYDAGNTTQDLFRRDMSAAQTTITISATSFLIPNPAIGPLNLPTSNSAVGEFANVEVPVGRYMSADGRFFTYATKANAALVVPGAPTLAPVGAFVFGLSNAGTTADQNDTRDVFIRDANAAVAANSANTANKLVSVATDGNAIGNVAGQEAFGPIISADGKNVLFVSNAQGGANSKQLVTGYVNNGAATDLYLRVDPFGATPTTELVSAKNGTTNSGANAAVNAGDYNLTPDAKFVVFDTKASNLVDPTLDANNDTDVYLRDRSTATATTEIVSVGTNGKTGTAASTGTSISNDGRYVAFQTASTNYVEALVDVNNATDVFVRDRTGKTTRAASTIPAGRATGDAASINGIVAPDGSQVFFSSKATDLISPNLTGTTSNIFSNKLPLKNPLDLPTSVAISGTANGQAQVFTFDASGNLTPAPGGGAAPFPGFTGDIRTATADIDGDGKDDVVYGIGPGGGSAIEVKLSSGGTIDLPAVYEATFTGGVFLAAGDIDGDGKAEIVVSPDVGGGGRVVVFRLNAAGNGLDRIADFFGIDDPNFRGGARVAVGDINGDGILDLVVAAGFGGGPRVAIFDGKSVLTNGNSPIKLRGDFFVFEQTLRNGVFVASGDFDGDSKGDIAFGGGPGGGPRVFILSGVNLLGSADPASTAPLANFFAGDPNQRGGIRLAAKDIDGDGKADLITGSGEGFPAQVRTYLGKNVITAANGSEPTVQQTFTPFGGPVSAAGIYVG